MRQTGEVVVTFHHVKTRWVLVWRYGVGLALIAEAAVTSEMEGLVRGPMFMQPGDEIRTMVRYTCEGSLVDDDG